jgi:cyanophycinase
MKTNALALIAGCAVVVAIAAGSARAGDDPPEMSQEGTCIVIGGALRRDNAAVYRRLIEAAGGADRCRFAVFPTANEGTGGARRFADTLASYGVPTAQIAIIDIFPENAARTAFDPAIVERIRRCNAAYFAGGDQVRIIEALLKSDGGDTPALASLRDMFRRGGLIAGSSAGAAVQSEIMISSAGQPAGTLDEGMDALDLGLTTDPLRSGLLVTRGLGFFRDGVIDQHFNQQRGRLGRLARVTAERRVHFGFGVDENTAMILLPDSSLEVVGTGCVTVLDAAVAHCEDGPLGCRIMGIRLACLQTGDRYDRKTGTILPNPVKEPIVPGSEWLSGNHLISDIAAAGSVPYALFSGLAANTSRKQVGTMLRYSRAFPHGYRFTFRKTEATRAWVGHLDDVTARAIKGVELSIEPIVGGLLPPTSAMPHDMPSGPAGMACRAAWFRGLLLADDRGLFHPNEPVTRADLATALAGAVHLVPPAGHSRLPPDVPETSPWADDVAMVLEAKLLELDSKSMFRPDDFIPRHLAAVALARAWSMGHSEKLSSEPVMLADLAEVPQSASASVFAVIHAGLLPPDRYFDPLRPVTRAEAAEALCRLIGLSWQEAAIPNSAALQKSW